jgi:membrane-associated phospholipid phosphatase
VAVYFGSDFLTARRAHHMQLYLRTELGIPFWPWMIVVYDSLYVLLLLAPFILRTREQVTQFARNIAISIVVAGVLFLLIPAQIGFTPVEVTGPMRTMFTVTDRLNLDYNLVPSLHVTFALLCVFAFWPDRTRTVRVALVLWLVALVTSTLVTHQHHLIDAFAGAALAWGVYWVTAARKASSQIRSTSDSSGFELGGEHHVVS